jgi:nicotinic acid mononucleotide adenylyltransferase
VVEDGSVSEVRIDVSTTWELLDPGGPAEAVWVRPTKGRRAAVLLGAFDPITNAHIELLEASSRHLRMPGALCLTKVLLARGGDPLLEPAVRVAVADEIADRLGLGVILANRGTYLEVGRTLLAQNYEPVFVIGSDKLAQLADPSFYEDGDQGVDETFATCRFLVVRRPGAEVTRDDVEVIEPADVFSDPSVSELSATDVRRRVGSREPYDHLVPPEVALAVQGYTSDR